MKHNHKGMKLLSAFLLSAVMGIGMSAIARADGALSNLGSTDSIKLFVTPAVNYGVTISSVNTRGYDFGTVGINGVTRSTAPILVTNTGNTNENWMLRAIGLDTWTLADTVSVDQGSLLAVFTASTTATSPSDTEFTDALDYVDGTGRTVVYGDGNRYNLASGSVIATGGVSSNPALTNGHARNLWLKLRMPSSSSVATEQGFRLYVITAAP